MAPPRPRITSTGRPLDVVQALQKHGVHRTRHGGGHGPEGEDETVVSGGDGEDAGDGRAVRDINEEGQCGGPGDRMSRGRRHGAPPPLETGAPCG